MELIDAQIHPVLGGTPFAGVTDGDRVARLSADLAVAAMDAVGVRGAVVSWRDLELMRGYVERYPGRFLALPTAVSLSLDGEFTPVITHDGTAVDYLRMVSDTPWMVGVRLGISYGRLIDLYRAGVHEPYYVAAEALGVPVFVTIHNHVPEYEQTIIAHPGLQFVGDHVGLPTPPNQARPGPQSLQTLPDVLALARFPNVAVKFTGVPALSAQPYPFAELWPSMRRLVDAFGPDRLMWGSDFTRTTSLHSYRDSVNFLALTDQLSDAEKHAIGAGTFRRLIGWPDA